MVEARIGNLFDSGAKTLVNTVNCVGVMGKGVALEFKKRFPNMYEDYALRCARNEVRLGKPYLYETAAGVKIINFPTKGHWRAASRLTDIASGLDYLADHTEEWKLTTVAMPPLGCGNGGLEWADVGPLIYEKLSPLPIKVVVFAPYGTPTSQLDEEFLRARRASPIRAKGEITTGLGEGAIVLLETLRQLYMQPFAHPIGRTKFQKVAYALTIAGVPTGYTFKRSAYGPFSAELRAEVPKLANSNWLEEEPLGSMIVMRPTLAFDDARDRFRKTLDRYADAIKKTTDLFSRMKSTEQAEVTATVLFAFKDLERGGKSVDFDQVMGYVSDWKSHWANDRTKRANVLSSALTLTTLGWVEEIDFTRVDENDIEFALGY